MIETSITCQTKINKIFETEGKKIKVETSIKSTDNSFSEIDLTISTTIGFYSDTMYLNGMNLEELIEFRNMIDSLVNDAVVKYKDMFPDKLITLCK